MSPAMRTRSVACRATSGYNRRHFMLQARVPRENLKLREKFGAPCVDTSARARGELERLAGTAQRSYYARY